MTVVAGADPRELARAAAALRAGEVVAFPTETVYGLGALALDPAAVSRVFVIKGRPASNPVIVHVLDEAAAARLSSRWTPLAAALARAFWPGPLTIVVERAADVPDVVTAAGPTVGLRAPSHPIARALLAAVGAPVAAPSANRSEEISPTTAAHVVASLGDRVAWIVDGGPCHVGIESTVVDATGPRPVLLRAGSVGRAAIEAVAGPLALAGEHGVARAPGQLRRHYAPTKPVRALGPAERPAPGARVAVVGWTERATHRLPSEPASCARALYATLREADESGDEVWLEAVPVGEGWEAIADRLTRAAAPR